MKEEALEKRIVDQKPRIVYLSGKTCTGKTTFADFLAQHGYVKIELDKIVTESVVLPFNLIPGDAFVNAYRDEGPSEHADAFIRAAREEIAQAASESPVVIEGAVAKVRILKEIFGEGTKDFAFVYFHPVHLEIYSGRIRSRFLAGAHDGTSGLPKDFWAIVDPHDLALYKETCVLNQGIEKAILAYAQRSMRESKERLKHLKSGFTVSVVPV